MQPSVLQIHQPARPGGGRRRLPASSAVGVYWCFLLFAFSSSWLFLRFVFASFGSFIELRSSFVFIISHASLSLCSWNCRRFPGPANGCSRPSSAHGRLVSRFMVHVFATRIKEIPRWGLLGFLHPRRQFSAFARSSIFSGSFRIRRVRVFCIFSWFTLGSFLAAWGDFSRLSHGFEVVGSTRKQLSAMTSQVPVMASERLARKAASPSARR